VCCSTMTYRPLVHYSVKYNLCLRLEVHESLITCRNSEGDIDRVADELHPGPAITDMHGTNLQIHQSRAPIQISPTHLVHAEFSDECLIGFNGPM
jgi:hypothetical protein